MYVQLKQHRENTTISKSITKKNLERLPGITKTKITFPTFQFTGRRPLSSDLRKIKRSGLLNSAAVFTRNIRCMPSGPADLHGFSDLSFSKICSLVIDTSAMVL